MSIKRNYHDIPAFTLAGAVLLALTVAGTAPAAAAAYSVDVYEASGAGQFNAVQSSVGLLSRQTDASHASFTYDGPLSFMNTTGQNTTPAGDITSVFLGANASNISGYSFVSGPSSPTYGSLATLSDYLASSGSIARLRLWITLRVQRYGLDRRRKPDHHA